MATTLTLYKCNYCDKTLKTKAGINKHEKECINNPIHLDIKNRVEQIRCEATSVEDLVFSIKDYLLELGVEIVFTSYPSCYSEVVSNSHSAPRGYERNGGQTKAAPIGYPGWTGRWEGSIKVIDPTILGTSKCLSFWEITRGGISARAKELNFWYLNTGTGTSGDTFSIEGRLYLYDFPKMHKEYIDNGGAITDLAQEYVQVLDIYRKAYDKKLQQSIKENSTLKQILQLSDQCKKLEESMYNLHRKYIDRFITDFNKAYNVKPPKVPGAFVHNKLLAETFQQIAYADNAAPLPQLQSFIDKLEELTNKMSLLQEKNPEYFL